MTAPLGRSLRLRIALAILLLGAVVACDPVEDPDGLPTPTEETPTASDCAPGELSLSEEGVARGLTEALEDPDGAEGLTRWGHGGRFALVDLDDDGDLDLAVGHHTRAPDLYENDGRGHFTRHASGFEFPPELVVSISIGAIDLDGDRLPELILGGRRAIVSWANRGGFEFGASQVLLERPDEQRKVEFTTIAPGDADGDGDVDLLASTTGWELEEDGEPRPRAGSADYLLLGDGAGGFPDVLPLIPFFTGTSVLVGLMTDYDGDGQTDFMSPSDGGLVNVLWRGEGLDDGGLPAFVDVAPATHIDFTMAAMGLDAADLNEDGRLDYCITDNAPPMCLMSSDEGGQATFVEAGQTFLPVGQAGHTTGWSIDLADLDNDGRLEAMQASGPSFEDNDSGEPPGELPDLLWVQNADGRFQDRSAELGFGTPENTLGLATGDVDGDGLLDIVTAGPLRPPALYMGRCRAGGFVEVQLHGGRGNTGGFGAWVTVHAGGRSMIREVQGARGPAQGPTRLHFGLGGVTEIDSIEVRWPDGGTTEVDAPDVDTVVQIER